MSEKNFFFFKLFFKFIYFWLHWVFIAARGLSLVAAHGLLLLWSTGSRHVDVSSCGSQALERRLSSCGARA